mgnify:CR=1 FL=1
MSAKGRIIAKAVLGGIELAAFLWATGFWFGMGQRHGEKEADWIDDLYENAAMKHAYKRALKDFVKENHLSKQQRKEMFNRLFQNYRRAKAEDWGQDEINYAEEAVLEDYVKPPTEAVKKEEEKE